MIVYTSGAPGLIVIVDVVCVGRKGHCTEEPETAVVAPAQVAPFTPVVDPSVAF
jgi:hypothetical protein